ncbi:MAG: pyroglutamyl-peptidase I family protein [Candidatus Hodarchaeales archaeon]
MTGFESFGGYKINPSEVIAQKLDGKTFGNTKVIGKTISLRYSEIQSIITRLINETNPDFVINTGQASRPSISIERVAVNFADASKIAYNCGTKPNEDILVKGGPVAYFITLPVKQIAKYLQKNDIPCYVSNSAGTFGCNQLIYHTLNYLDSTSQLDSVIAGFIHLPLLPEQVVGSPQSSSMSMDVMEKAVCLIIEYLDTIE